MYRPTPAAAAATSKDLNLPYPPTSSFGGHRKEEPEAELPHHQSQQMSSGLLRLRSAPTSLLGELREDFLPIRPPSGAEGESMFSRFMTPDLRDRPSPHLRPPGTVEMVSPHHKVAFSSPPPMAYHSQQQRQQLQMPNHNMAESSHRAVGSMATAAEQIESGRNSNLTRQASSPSGFFSQLTVDNGYAMMRSLSGFRNGDLAAMGAGAAANNKLKSQLSFASRQSSLISQISDIGSEDTGHSNHEQSGGAAGGDQCYVPGVPASSWEDTSLLSANNFSGIKRGREDEEKIFVGFNHSETQSHVPGLTHHLSLQKTSPEIAAVERFFQFQDAVPCRVRAKRGCATHPRSIAERVRRTKISERMRKLQELVPNMDKQTNTADMLDLAVDYIKDLQKQVKVLTESRASCTCLSGKQRGLTQLGSD